MAWGQGEIDFYYRNPSILARMVQYLGGETLEDVTSIYVSRCDCLPDPPYLLRKPEELSFYLSKGLDVGRSLWDRRSLLFHLDIDYVNYDSPIDAFLQREKSFRTQEPLIRQIKTMLGSYGIVPLDLLSGRGHHFVWQVNRESFTFGRVLKQGYLPSTLEGKYGQALPPRHEPLPTQLGRAYAGVGMIMEYVAYRAREEAGSKCEIPIQIADILPSGNGRREIVCLDLSEYGDPLHMRMTRIPFSIYRKQQNFQHGSDDLSRVPPALAMVPLEDSNLLDALRSTEDLERATEIAGRANTRIPDLSEQTAGLVSDYEASAVKTFHQWFYAEDHDDPARWPRTYDLAPVHHLPPCGRRILACPNDLLLKPTAIQLIVRLMLSWGWHPRHIAGLIRSKYERDFGWGPLWYEYDAAARADFYVRILSGAFVLGQDDLQDLTCPGTQKKALCPGGGSCEDLSLYRRSLEKRKSNGQLGRGPFNRLLL